MLSSLKLSASKESDCWVSVLVVCVTSWLLHFTLQDFDFEALEKSTGYENGFTENSPMIR